MKVGGNESATKYFQSHGGAAALASKDAKVRYTSPAATKYKDELKRRAAVDAREYARLPSQETQFSSPPRSPEEVVIADVLSPTFADGTSTPNAEPSDDFFSSWDKPAIKRPSNPPSRTGTPNISRTASPFLKAGPGAEPRSKSPANGVEAENAPPAASRTTSSAALRKTATTGGARKANVLGAKKNQKIGAKKVGGGGDVIDFEEAEKKAKEEAERIAKLGYDPEADDAPAAVTSPVEAPKILSPTPVSPPSTNYGASQSKGHQRSASEVERLGMGMGRLGFGQVGAAAKSSAPAPKKLGFGAVGGSKPAAESSSPFPILSLTGAMMQRGH